ncbi:hypothetical protein ApDm4_0987 [Acetobacter pomorum]|nr:hypothetical protein ApDm4_0987 [Acetobacter pomorum]
MDRFRKRLSFFKDRTEPRSMLFNGQFACQDKRSVRHIMNMPRQ